MSKHHVQAALRHIRRILEAVNSLDETALRQLDHKSRFTTRPDGYPTATLADDGSRSTDPTTSVERAALRLADPTIRTPADPVGVAIRNVFDLLGQMSDCAARIVQQLAYIEHVRSSAEGRQSSLAGECVACGEVVSGTEADRLRAGLCGRCHVSMRQSPIADRDGWLAYRRAWLADNPRLEA